MARAVAALLFLLLALGTARAASYDCARAGTPAEKTVCATPALSKLDDEANFEMRRNVVVFSDASKDGGPVLADLGEQLKKWVADRQACGEKVDCLNRAYTEQLATLEFRARPGKQAWPDRAAGVYSYQGFANLWIQPRDDDSVRVSVSTSNPNGSHCIFVAIGQQDGKLIKAGSIELEAGKGFVNMPATDTNLATNTKSCSSGGSMIWRYGAR